MNYTAEAGSIWPVLTQTLHAWAFAAPIHNSTTRVHLLLLFLGYKLKFIKLPRINPPLKIVGSLCSCCRKGI